MEDLSSTVFPSILGQVSLHDQNHDYIEYRDMKLLHLYKLIILKRRNLFALKSNLLGKCLNFITDRQFHNISFSFDF